MTGIRHFLDLDALDAPTLRAIIDKAHELKAGWRSGTRPRPLTDRVLATLFEKPSTRTRVSYDLAMRQLGGETIHLSSADMQLGRGETVADTARVLSRYVDAVMIRAARHETLLELARHASVPVINGLTDRSHPSQLMADVMTYEEHRGAIGGATVAWAGDGNNMACSWIHAAVRFGFELRVACPPSRRPARRVLDWAARNGGGVTVVDHVEAAVAGADCVVTDTWVSMSDERAATEAVDSETLAAFRIDEAVMGHAGHHAIFMHCMPIYRGNEVSAAVADGPRSVVIDEAENRLHAQKAIIAWCLT